MMKRLLLFLLMLCASAFAQVSVVPLCAPYCQFFDASGKPLAGGKVFTYQAGTTTPQATYVDSAGVIQNANPVILDAGGFAQIWIAGQAYKFVVQTSAGVQIRMADNVQGYNGIVTGTANITGTLTSSTANPASGCFINSAVSDKYCQRNNANSLSLNVESMDSSDRVVLGDTTGVKFPSFYDIVCTTPAPALSSAGQIRTYCDSALNNQVFDSVSGGAFLRRRLKLFAQGNGSAIANTAAETVYYTANTAHIPAGTINNVGDTLQVRFSGVYSTTATPTLQIRIRLDSLAGTVILDTTAQTMANNASGNGIGVQVTCFFTAVGAGGSMDCENEFGINAVSSVGVTAPTTIAFDTTVAHDIVPTAQWGTANASNTTTGRHEIFNLN